MKIKKGRAKRCKVYHLLLLIFFSLVSNKHSFKSKPNLLPNLDLPFRPVTSIKMIFLKKKSKKCIGLHKIVKYFTTLLFLIKYRKNEINEQLYALYNYRKTILIVYEKIKTMNGLKYVFPLFQRYQNIKVNY